MIITKHAYQRAKQRLRWKRSTLDRMSEIALEKGIKHNEVKGQLKKYFDKLWIRHKSCNNPRLYGQNVFMFKGKKLITIFRLPNNLIKYIPKMELTLSIDTTNEKEVNEALHVLKLIAGESAPTVQETPAKEEKPKRQRRTKPTPAPEKAKAEKHPKEEPKEQQVDAEEVRTIDQVREILSKKVGDHRAAIKSKLKELGAPNVTQLDPEKYGEFYTYLEGLE